MRKVMLLLMLVVLMLPTGLVFGQGGEPVEDATPLAAGETAQGQLSDENPEDVYSFTATGGEVISVAVIGEGFDSVVELRDADGVTLASDDDSGGNLNPLLSPFTLPADGTYYIVVRRFSETGGGAYTVRLFNPEAITLTPNEAVTVTAGAPIFLVYDSANGALVSLSGSGDVSNGVGYGVRVTDDQGFFVNSGFSDPNGDMFISPLTLSEGTTYWIVPFLQSQTGAPLPAEATTDITLTISPLQSQPITLGESVSGTLSDENPAMYFSFTNEANQLFRLEGSSTPDGLPIDVQIYSVSSAYNYNGGGTGFTPEPSFVVDPIAPPSTGENLIIVRRLDTTGAGVSGGTSNFTLTLGETTATVLESGVAVEGSMDSMTFEQVYLFEGTAGQTIRITLAATDDVYAPNGDVQAPQNEIGIFSLVSLSSYAPGGSIVYEAALPIDGYYIFRIRSAGVGPAPSANYSLLVEVVE